MRALTVRQPWATLLVRGIKRAENRTWDYRPQGGAGGVAKHPVPGQDLPPTWTAIHAGTLPWEGWPLEVARALEDLGHPDALLWSDAEVRAEVQRLPLGVFVGAVQVDWTGPVDEYLERWPDDRYARGPRCWHVARAVELPPPTRPVRGSLGLWNLVDPEIDRALQAAIAVAEFHDQVRQAAPAHAALPTRNYR